MFCDGLVGQWKDKPLYLQCIGRAIVKSHGNMEGVYVNGAPQRIAFHETDDFTLYPANILTVSRNRFTKHYFIGSRASPPG